MGTTQLAVYQEAIRHLGDARLSTVADGTETRYVLDDAWATAPLFVLRQAAWRFAQVTEGVTGAAPGTIPGYTYKFSMPANWLRTAAIYTLSGSKECPVDVKEQISFWYCNTQTLTVRYVSSFYATELTLWPEHFTKAVAVYLAYDVSDRISGDTNRKAALWTLFQQYLRNAMEHDADAEDVWLKHQLDGSFLSASRNMLTQGFWRFALDTATPVASGTADPGFSTLYTKPTDWLRTQAVYTVSGAKELPVDCREGKGGWSANSAIKVRFISSTYLDATRWPEEFMRVVAAYLGINWGDGAPATDKGEPQLPWPQYLQRALDNIAMPESPWLRHQFDGSFFSASKNMLTQGNWRFALSTVTPTAAGVPEPGFASLYSKPADWMRTQNVYVLLGLSELPVNCREGPTGWSASTAIKVRYVSSTYLDPTTWPEEFLRVVAAFLDIDWDESPNEKDDTSVSWPQRLQRALDNLAVPDSPWLKHQFDGSFLSASKNMLEQGFWHFAMKTATPSVSGVAVAGFSTSFAKPVDWMRTHSVFKVSGSKELPVDCREQGEFWSANEAIKVRYVSTDYVTPTLWTEEFLRVVAAYLGIDWGDGNARAVTPDGQGGQKLVLWPQYLKQALDNSSLPPSQWLPFQLDGSFAHGVDKMLESGLWKFAIVTVALTSAGASTSPSYAYYFTKPTGWIRTVRVYDQLGTSPPTNDCDIDFRDEGGKLHANVTPIVLRYLSSTLGRAPENWSDDFMQALLAYLVHERAVGDPNMSAAGLQARAGAYKEAEKNARIKDEMRERPKVNTLGVLRQSRGGYGGSYGRMQGWWW